MFSWDEVHRPADVAQKTALVSSAARMTSKCRNEATDYAEVTKQQHNGPNEQNVTL